MAFQSVEPSSGRVLKTYEPHSPDEVDKRLAQAHGAFLDYRRTSFAERGRLMEGVADLLDAEQPDIGRLLTEEMGKTFAEAKAEVSKCARAMRYFAKEAERLLAEEHLASAASSSGVRYQPLGPVLAVMPWNFPLWQVVRFAAPALMAGNVGVLKHASNVPQTALVLEDLFRRAGYPEGAFTTLLIESKAVAGVIADDRVAAVTLTGSNRAGQAVAAAAGQALKKSVLELGGSDPFVVLASADMDRAVETAVRARVQNNGQSCIAAKRFIVVEEVAETFSRRFVEAMGNLTVGDPMEPATDVGPLATESQRDQLAEQVDDARDKGATIECGGRAPERPGWYFQPTVITGITPDMKVAHEEVFGPVATLFVAADVSEAIAMANASQFGLGASVWTADHAERQRLIDELDSGMVFVNAMVASNPELPFGGVKASGYGRELSGLGIKEFCNAKTFWID
jgi:succinate-semialdehyde dehydrogenase/glutarate-semialdehyde dehydrogenase